MHGVIHALGLRMLTWALLMCTALVSGREEAMLVVQGKPYCSRGIPCQCLPAVYTCPLYGTLTGSMHGIHCLLLTGGVALVTAWESSEVSVSRAGFLSPTPIVDYVYTTGCVWAFQCVSVCKLHG